MPVPKEHEVIYSKGFLRDVRRLPSEAVEKLAFLLALLAADPFDLRLHTKPLHAPLRGVYTLRITRDWRVAFEFVSETTLKLVAADHRDAIYKRLARNL